MGTPLENISYYYYIVIKKEYQSIPTNQRPGIVNNNCVICFQRSGIQINEKFNWNARTRFAAGSMVSGLLIILAVLIYGIYLLKTCRKRSDYRDAGDSRKIKNVTAWTKIQESKSTRREEIVVCVLDAPNTVIDLPNEDLQQNTNTNNVKTITKSVTGNQNSTGTFLSVKLDDTQSHEHQKTMEAWERQHLQRGITLL